MQHFDVIIIGSGLAGLTVAYNLRHAKRNVAVIEEHRFGGVVENNGSTRKKELATVAHIAELNQRLTKIGIQPAVTPDWKATMEWVNQLEDGESNAVQDRFNQAGITTIAGHAHFLSNQVITVAGRQYSADQFVIATGARDRIIHCDAGQNFLQDSSAFLTDLKVPNDITIIGAGIIAFAFMSIATSFGKKVHVLQHDERALANFDQEMVNKLISHYVQKGVDFRFDNSVRRVDQTSDGLQITTDRGETFTTQAIYRAAGRVPNVDHLGLEKAGVQYDHHGVVVDKTLQSTQNNIFACGDCAGVAIPKLATYAAYQANYLSQRMATDLPEEIHFPIPAMSTFSQPRLAQAGVLINDAIKQPSIYEIQTINMKNWLDQRRYLAEYAEAKIIINKADDRVVGASVLSDDADILINYITLLLTAGITKSQLKKIIFAYPSMATDLSRLW